MWLRWSWRDLRSHWVAVVAIGLVLAIGTGVYAGLGSTATWRRQSNDASFAALSMHDLRVTLSPGTFSSEGSLLGLVDSIGAGSSIDGAVERLEVDSQVATGSGTASVLVPARLVGMSFAPRTPVDDVWIVEGASPEFSGSSVLEAKFAESRGLPSTGSVTVAGGHRVAYDGLGIAPEDFFYEGPEGTIFAEGELAILYLPLASAQEITGRSGMVNDLVVTLVDGADRDVVETDLVDALSERGLSAVVTTRDDADAIRVLYDDIENDQRFWNALSALVLVAAGLAAFNLVSRIVEAQRREIGIGMALGVPRSQLAIRPLLVGFQVAALGTLAGVGVGVVVGGAFGNLLESFLPLPVYRTSFQTGVFARAAVIGLIVPIGASALPIWRAVRVEPIEAIRTGHLTARTSRLTDWTGRVRLPGSSTTQMPLRNLLRNPRRTMLTAIGVGAAITSLVAVLGMLDSFTRAIQQGGDEFTKGEPDRILVQLDTFHPIDSDVVAAVESRTEVGTVDVALRLPATALAPGDGADIDLLVEGLAFDGAAWSPTIVEAESGLDVTAGIVLAPKAADDLGLGVGDTLTLRHPARTGEIAFTLVESEFVVSGIHANPIRTFAFVDLGLADRFGLDGVTNLLHVYPADGVARSDVQQAIFDLPSVTSSQPVARIGEAIDEALQQFVGFLFVTGAFVLVLALLISFNATRITVEERRREHATMRAFGLPLRAIIGVVVKESVIVGAIATGIGLGAGVLFLRWMLASLATTTLPDVGIDAYVSPVTIVIAALVGIVAVGVAPLFLIHRVSGMDVPDTLRVME